MCHFMHVILYSGGRTLTSDLKVSFWRFYVSLSLIKFVSSIASVIFMVNDFL